MKTSCLNSRRPTGIFRQNRKSVLACDRLRPGCSSFIALVRGGTFSACGRVRACDAAPKPIGSRVKPLVMPSLQHPGCSCRPSQPSKSLPVSPPATAPLSPQRTLIGCVLLRRAVNSSDRCSRLACSRASTPTRLHF